MRARDSRRPAAKLASKAAMQSALAVAPVAMVQYPAGALCTELWNRVGEIMRSSDASVSQIAWQVSPSPLEDAKTAATRDASSPAAPIASSPVASASFTHLPARRR